MKWLKKLIKRVPVWKRKIFKLRKSETVRLIIAIAKLILKRKGGGNNG